MSGEHSVSHLRGNAKGLEDYNDAAATEVARPKTEGAAMKTKQVSRADMQKRVARFKDLRSSTQAFVDSLIPGHERKIFNVIGRGVTEDA